MMNQQSTYLPARSMIQKAQGKPEGRPVLPATQHRQHLSTYVFMLALASRSDALHAFSLPKCCSSSDWPSYVPTYSFLHSP